MSDDDAVQRIADRIEIQEAMFRFGRMLDCRDGTAFEDVHLFMTPDVILEYPFGTWVGLSAAAKMIESTLHRYCPVTQHMITNPLIQINGDTAVAEYCLAAIHTLVDEDGTVSRDTESVRSAALTWGGGIYRQELVRTDAGWRVRRHILANSWLEDDGGALMNALSKGILAAQDVASAPS